MEEKMTDNLFEKKHDRLWSIASFIKLLAWIVLIFQMVHVATEIFNLQNSYVSTENFFNSQAEYEYRIKHDFFFIVKVLVPPLLDFFKGILYWLVAKGISMGLFMIIETDINYRENLKEAINE